MPRFVIVQLLSVFMLGLLSGCGSAPSAPPQAEAPPPEAPPPPPAEVVQTAADTAIKFKLEDGQERFSLKFKSDGAKLEDGTGAELARLKQDETLKVKIKAPDETVLGYVVPTETGWKLENAEQTEERYILRRQEDGDFKLETGADEAIYRIKRRDYGFEIETPDKQSLYKVKVKPPKISLRNADDQTVLYTKDALNPIALVPFGFDELSEVEQAAIAYAMHQSGGG